MTTEAPQSPPARQLFPWRRFLYGPIIWFVDQNIVYALTSLSCYWGWFPFNLAGVLGLRVVQTFVTLVAAATMLRLIYLAWHDWRRFQTARPAHNPNVLRDTEQAPQSLVAFMEMLLNALLLLFLLSSLVTIFTLNPCV